MYSTMAASNVEYVGLADLVSCPVCFETDGEPKRLPCDHTYCVGCLQNMVDKARETDIAHGRQPSSQITCPQCRLTVDIPDGRSDNLPTHLLMKQLREVLSGNEGEDNEKPKCHVCKSVTDIERFCTDCKMIMCEMCTEKHSKRAAFKDHTFKQISVFCPVHKQPSTFACSDCQILLCVSCVNEGVCEDHHIKDISELCDDIMTKTDNLIDNIQKHIDESQEDIQNKTTMIRELEDSVKKSEIDIASMKALLLAAKEAREKSIEQMFLITPVIMKRLPDKKTKVVTMVTEEADTHVSVKQPTVNISQKYTLAKPATQLWKKQLPGVFSILLIPKHYLVFSRNESNQIGMYDTKGNVISSKSLQNVTPFGLAYDPHTSSVVVACGEKGLGFYSDTDLEWKQDLVLQRVVENTLSACDVGVLSTSNLVVTTASVGIDDTIGIYDRKGTMLNMITKCGIKNKQLQVCNPKRITVLKDDTIVVIMEDKLVYVDKDLQCTNIVHFFANRQGGGAAYNHRNVPLDVCPSCDGTTTCLSVMQTYTVNRGTKYEKKCTQYNMLHLLPARNLEENGGLDLDGQIYSITIRDGKMAVIYRANNVIKMFNLYMEISARKSNVY